MASVTEKPQPKKPDQPTHGSEERLVDQQIGRTRRALKAVDLTAGLITLAIGVLAYLLTMSVLEHWVVPGGWSDGARGLLFAVLVIGCLYYCWRIFWPLLRQPINPAYAAQAIEQSSPSLKNSLLNLLLLRNHKRQMSRQVYQAIESQAAQGLSQVRMETVVDRSAILRLGYVLVALTAVCVLYRVLSPKDLFSSAGRVLLPWSDIAAPSRVTISKVTPGDTKTARGEQLAVTAEVLGLEADEPVRLLYSTMDKQVVDQEVPMSASESGTLFTCKVPARLGGGDRRGVQQDFTYWIEAGDVRSPNFSVSMFARPTMVVHRLRYDYPAYTGFPSREVEHTGDIRAVEGTRVTVFAQANKPIKSAHVDFEADGRRDLLMNSSDQQASATFPLALREDRRTPEHRSYVLKYTTVDGNQNQLPPKYQIEVQPDYAPEIQLLLPEEAMLEVALNQEVNFELEARDPDFALRQVMLIGKLGDEVKLQEQLLALDHTGKFVGKLRRTPQEMGLKPGDVLEYWGAAADNRRPEPNLAYSAHRKLRVVGPWNGNEQREPGEQEQEGEAQNQPGENGDPSEGEGGQEGQAGGGEQGNSSEGEGQSGEEGQSGNGEPGNQENADQQQQGGGQGESNGEPNEGNNSQGGANGNSPNQDGNSDSQSDDNQQPSEDDTGSEGGQGKVSSEGDDDGAAFDRMAEHFNEQSGQSGEGKSEPDAGAAEGQRDRDQSSDGNESSENPEQREATEGNTGTEQAGEGEAGQGESEAGQQDRGSSEAGEQASGEQEAGEQGDQSEQQGESPEGNMSGEQGEAGAGDRSGDQQGAPDSNSSKKPQDKQGDGTDSPEQQNSEAPSESGDQSESDSEGGQSGDRSGGGQEGAGQQAEESGQGSAGENEAADEGAGSSSEQGEGESGKQAGNHEKADGKTGESSGDQKGSGSEQHNQSGDQPEGEAGAESQGGQPGGQPSQGQTNDGQAGEQATGDQQPPMSESDPASDQNATGDPSGTGGQASPPPESELQDADDPNLKYAEKQTDLILDRLEDQLKKKEVDKSLLEKLGWTQDELRRFVDRWKGLKSQAKNDPRAADELNDSLRSLGLNRKRRTGYNSKVAQDQLRDLQEGYRVRVPLEYQDQVNRYIKGTANPQEAE